MKKSFFKAFFIPALFLICIIGVFAVGINVPIQKTQAASQIQHVFIIAMENHNWSTIKGSSQAPYINKTLLPMGGHAEQYYNPPNNHPSAPNYVWLEAGAAVAGKNDCTPPSSGCSSSVTHLTKLLDTAGISWKEYAEDTNGKSCILNFSGADVNHVGFSYFTDVTNNNNPNSANCIAHERPYTELATDLQNNTVARYNFITPNVIDDMHNGTLQQGDTWLSHEVPKILNSQAYKTGGVLFIVWDEAENGDGPIGMIVESPFAKKNYSNTIHYDHSSTLKTLEEIFGVSPLLGKAASATDLSDFFTIPLTSKVSGSPTPSDITPSFVCLGAGCPVSPSSSLSPSISLSPSSSISPSVSLSGSPSPNKGDHDKDKDNKSNHKHHHKNKNGAVSNSLKKLIQELITILNQLLANFKGNQSPNGNQPSISPSSSPSNSPSDVLPSDISPSQ